MLSVRKTFFVVCSLLVAIPIGLFWLWPHSNLLKEDYETVSRHHLVLAKNAAAGLSRYQRDLIAIFEHTAAELDAGDPNERSEALLANHNIRFIAKVDPVTGHIAKGFAADGWRLPSQIGPEVLLQAKRTANERETAITPIVSQKSDRPVFAVVKQSGKSITLGVADTTYLTALVENIKVGHYGHGAVVDSKGRLAAQVTVRASAPDDISTVPLFQKLMNGESGVGTFTSPAFGMEMIAGYASAGHGWGVIVPQPVVELNSKAQQANSSVISVLAIGLLGATLVALRAGLFVVVPIRRILHATQLMTSGDISTRIPLSSRGAPRELRQLERAFNEMAESIANARRGEVEAREKAEQASRAKSDFVRYVAHELRSPTNAVIGFAELLAGERHGPLGNPKYREHVRDISSVSRHLLSLVNDLLDLSKIESGQYQLHHEQIGIDELVDRCCRYLKPAATERRISVTPRYVGEPATVVVDERAMFQVILNLVTNAVRYCDEGAHVQIECRPAGDGGVEVVILDDGPGIAAQDLKRVMEPFQRVETRGNRKIQGSGLGLPIVKRLVEMHGGRFKLESEIGIGTRATICLPPACVCVAAMSESLIVAA